MLNRREFAAATTLAAAPAMLKAAGTLESPPRRSSYAIPAVQSWNPQTDQFAPYFPFGWYSFGPSARIEEIAEKAGASVNRIIQVCFDWRKIRMPGGWIVRADHSKLNVEPRTSNAEHRTSVFGA